MKFNRLSRRFFLQGVGGSLVAIPALESLAPKLARAQAAPAVAPRYVQWISNLGMYDSNFWPDAKYLPSDAVGDAADGVRARALASIPGPLSRVLGTNFDPLRTKMNLVRGLDLVMAPHYHNSSASTCASFPLNDGVPPTVPLSIDAVLETSKKVYGSAVRASALRITPGTDQHGSVCWKTVNGKPYLIPCLTQPTSVLQQIFGGNLTPQAAAALKASNLRLTDVVLADYKGVVQGGSIGSQDKALLSNYMDLLAGVQMRLQLPNTCKAPAQTTASDFDSLHQNSIDLTVAALLCGATKVVSYHVNQGSSTQYDPETFHGWSHTDADKHGNMMVWRYQQLAKLLSAMDAVTESNGKTLLDNSVVYASNCLSKPNHGVNHLKNMPVITAGSAGGALATGQYIDFGSRLMNNMLVTLFQTMGLGPSDFEQTGNVGFGEYQGDDSKLYAAYLSNTEKREPLPYLYRGAEA